MFSASIFAGRQIRLQFRTEELPPNRRFFCVGRNDLANYSTDRGRMLGAVVGKALESLREGSGVIQVLVTLQ